MPGAIAPPETTADLAVVVLQRNATGFIDHAPGARSGSDPHHVHQMRVATRRVRAALRLFADLLPAEASSLDAELRWFAGQLGPVRDLDVQILGMRHVAHELGLSNSLGAYESWLQQQLERARAHLATAFESRRFGVLVQQLQRLDDWTPQARAGSTNVPLFEDAPRRMRRAYRQLRERADAVDSQSPAADLHAVRIRAKRVRYTAEFFEIAYRKPARQFVTRVVAMQDLLGKLQDSVVSRAQIHAAVRSSDATWRVESTLALGQLMQYEAEREKDFRAQLPATYNAIRKKAWPRLRKALKRRA